MIGRAAAALLVLVGTAVSVVANDTSRPPIEGKTLTPPPPDQRAARAHVAYAPQRYDDILWENDRTAHRIYGPALEAYEPPSTSGIDAWGKHVPWPFMERQLATGQQHGYHGEGIDFYHVGTTRGVGGLGIWHSNKLWTSRNWHSYRILQDGPTTADFEVDYASWPVDLDRRVWETRRFTLPTGTNFTRVTSLISSDKAGPLIVGIGMARRPTGPADGRLIADRATGRFIFWGPEYPKKGAMGTALIVDPAQIANVVQDADNYLVLLNVTPGQRFTYYIGATWSLSGQFANAAAWEAEVRTQPAVSSNMPQPPLSHVPARPMIVVDENSVKRDEPPPHGNIGMSTAYRISDAALQPRAMEFRKRVLHKGAAIGLHPIDHDEVYYVLSGEGDVTSDGVTQRLKPGMAAYLYKDAVVGIKQFGKKPLTVIISYPNNQP